jgi:hypothetical protein
MLSDNEITAISLEALRTEYRVLRKLTVALQELAGALQEECDLASVAHTHVERRIQEAKSALHKGVEALGISQRSLSRATDKMANDHDTNELRSANPHNQNTQPRETPRSK